MDTDGVSPDEGRIMTILEPIEVRDEHGDLVGYLIEGFVEVHDYPALVSEAKSEAARLRLDV